MGWGIATETTNSESATDKAEVDRLLEHWKRTLELRNDQITTFDKSVLWASGGALALTIANVDKLGGASDGVGILLLASWLSFAISVCSNVISYWTSTQDAECELERIRESVEEGRPYVVGNRYRTATYVFNFMALGLFLIGVFLLITHAYLNLGGTR